jgi:DNA-binding NtrC family response regulator
MSMNARILIVDDDPVITESLAELLRAHGHEVCAAPGESEAKNILDQDHGIQIVISDIALPGPSGLELLKHIRARHPAVAVILLTGYGSVEAAVQALRLGAVDFLTKPVAEEELRQAIERALRKQVLMAERVGAARGRSAATRSPGSGGLGGIVGSNARMQRLYELIEAVAPSRTTVLMTGESGVGKSLVARAIHDASPRSQKPFVELSCGSIPETLLESELFGHVKGAFTGAHADKVGRFLAGSGGTVFLDEINSASPGMQLKLLRVIQERRFEPVGSTQTVEVDVRIVLASNQPLEQLVAEGTFRQDLYYRINVIRIELPPLRERPDDIEALALHFLNVHGAELGKQLAGFTPDAMTALRAYAFPGNVRELQNIVERAAVLSHRPTITIDDLPDHLLGRAGAFTCGASPAQVPTSGQDDGQWSPMPLEEALREPEKRILLRALKANRYNRQQTADQLGINRTTLYKKMRAYGIEAA